MSWRDWTFRSREPACGATRRERSENLTIPAARRRGSAFGILAATLLLVLSLPVSTAAQKGAPSIPPLKEEATKPAAEGADDPLGRDTPFGTIRGFIRAAEREDWDRAAEYLDTEGLPKQARKTARDLAAVLDAADLRDPSRKPEGNMEDGLQPGSERVGSVETASGSYEILLDRANRGSGSPIWLFSAETLKWVPRVHGDLGISWIERRLSGTPLETRFLGYTLWRWIGILLVVPLSFGIARLATRLLLPAIPDLFRRVARRPVDYPAARLKWPISLLVMAIVFYAVSLIAFSASSRVFWGYVAATVATIALTWTCLRLIDDAGGLFEGGIQARLGTGTVAMARLLDKLSKALVILAGALVLFYIAGVNLTAVLAGVGIGGVAVALAAQKSLENLFGAMTIISDKPIRVGDFCRVGEFTGTVEDIGLRSTRIKTVGRSIVSVPNGQLITMSLENFSMRDKFLFGHRLHLDPETSAAHLRAVIANIRNMLLERPRIETATARVSLTGIRNLSIEVDVFAFVLETSYDAFLAVQEDLLLRIVDIVEASGAKFAAPHIPAFQPAGDRHPGSASSAATGGNRPQRRAG